MKPQKTNHRDHRETPVFHKGDSMSAQRILLYFAKEFSFIFKYVLCVLCGWI